MEKEKVSRLEHTSVGINMWSSWAELVSTKFKSLTDHVGEGMQKPLKANWRILSSRIDTARRAMGRTGIVRISY